MWHTSLLGVSNKLEIKDGNVTDIRLHFILKIKQTVLDFY